MVWILSIRKNNAIFQSELRYELSRNKPMTDIIDGGADSAVWNKYLKRQGDAERARGAEDGRPRWFETSWLLAECYAYRRMLQASALRYDVGVRHNA